MKGDSRSLDLSGLSKLGFFYVFLCVGLMETYIGSAIVMGLLRGCLVSLLGGGRDRCNTGC